MLSFIICSFLPIFLLLYGSLYDPVYISYYIASNGTMTDEQWIRKDLAGSDVGLIEVISGHFLEVLSKTAENLNEDSQCPNRVSK
jgi:hypothetical protein